MTNLAGYIASIVTYQVFGTIWYSDAVFGKAWKKRVFGKGIRGPTSTALVVCFVNSVIVTVALAWLQEQAGVRGYEESLKHAAMVGVVYTGLGAIAATFKGASTTLQAIDFGHSFLSLVLMAAALTYFR